MFADKRAVAASSEALTRFWGAFYSQSSNLFKVQIPGAALVAEKSASRKVGGISKGLVPPFATNFH